MNYKRLDATTKEHRVLAASILGRELYSQEVVHHLDGDMFNNSLSNLMVLSSPSDHNKIHGKHYTPIVAKRLDGSHVVLTPRFYNRKRWYGNKHGINPTHLPKIEWPKIDDLKHMVAEIGQGQSAKRLGVSRTAIQKHLKRYG